MLKDEWLKDRILYLKGFKNRNEQQELLLILAEKTERTAQEEKKYNAIIKAELALIRLNKAKAQASKLINDEKQAEKKAERKARDHELYNSAGLLIMAGLVDTKTGKPLIDKSELLGALVGLSKVPNDDARRKEWKRVGDTLMGEDKK